MKSISATIQNQLNTGELRTAHLVEISLGNPFTGADYDVFMTDYHTDISVSSGNYLATGHLLGISEIRNTSDLQISELTLTLSGVDQGKIFEVLAFDYIDREIIIRRAILDVNDSVIGTPTIMFRGRISNPSIVDNPNEGSSIVSVTASSYLADFDRKPARHTNHIEHNYYYPNDDFFKLWGQIDKEIIWGYMPD